MTQETLPFNAPPKWANIQFNGPEYDPDRDNPRLSGQIERVFDLMQDSEWRSLRAIAAETNDPENSVSAQLRHLRKKRFGAHTVNRKHIALGYYLYQLIPNT